MCVFHFHNVSCDVHLFKGLSAYCTLWWNADEYYWLVLFFHLKSPWFSATVKAHHTVALKWDCLKEAMFALEPCQFFSDSSCGAYYLRNMLKVCPNCWTHLGIALKWQSLGGLSLGDWELSNSMLNLIRRFGSVHRFLPLFQQVLSNYVTLTQARTHTCKGKKGNGDNWK